MICLNCGHKNPESNKFCGECGSPVHPTRRKEDLERAAQFTVPVTPEANDRKPAQTPPAANPADASRTTVAPVVTQISQPAQNPLVGENRPIRETNRIAGPSLLGLSIADEEQPGADEPPSYLLEEPERRTNWRAILAIIVLAVVGILFYLEWDSIKTAASDTAVKNGLVQPNPKPAAGTTVTPTGPTKDPLQNAKPAAKDADPSAETKPEASTPQLEQAQPDSKQDQPQSDDDDSGADPKEPAAAPAPKASLPTYDNSQVQLAEQYLQGRGVPQNCEMGVSILQRAAANNPRARIQLGALYATGHCVDRDPAEAYHWFARAKQLEPHNTWLDRNMRSLMESMNEWDRRKALALAHQDAPARNRD